MVVCLISDHIYSQWMSSSHTHSESWFSNLRNSEVFILEVNKMLYCFSYFKLANRDIIDKVTWDYQCFEEKKVTPNWQHFVHVHAFLQAWQKLCERRKDCSCSIYLYELKMLFLCTSHFIITPLIAETWLIQGNLQTTTN